MENEKKMLEQAAITSTVMSKLLEHHERENKRLWIALCACIISLLIMAICMIWTVMNIQNVANEALENALNTVAEIGVTTETTETITVEQDTGEGSGNNVYQAGEYATYSEGGAK